MNPLLKALGTILVLAAGTLGTSLEHGLPLPVHSASEGDATGDGNETADNETADGNETSPDGNGTTDDGNETADDDAGDNETATDDNETAADGNETADDADADDNETAEQEPTDESGPVCSYSVDDWGDDLTPQHHEWEWLITHDVHSLSVDFYAYSGIPTSLGSHPSARLVDGSGRTLASSSSNDGGFNLYLERGVDYLADGEWRLTFDSSDIWSDYYAQVTIEC